MLKTITRTAKRLLRSIRARRRERAMAAKRSATAKEFMRWLGSGVAAVQDRDAPGDPLTFRFDTTRPKKSWYAGVCKKLIREGLIVVEPQEEWYVSECRGGWNREYRNIVLKPNPKPPKR